MKPSETKIIKSLYGMPEDIYNCIQEGGVYTEKHLNFLVKFRKYPSIRILFEYTNLSPNCIKEKSEREFCTRIKNQIDNRKKILEYEKSLIV